MSEERKRPEEIQEESEEVKSELDLEDLEKVSGGGLFDALKLAGKESWSEKK